MKLAGKKVIAIGDRDGINGETIEAVMEDAGADVVFTATECFVCTAAGSVDLPNQKRIKEIMEDSEDGGFIAILGVCDNEGAKIHAKTVTTGDPAYVGALAGVSLHLPVYHVLEEEIKSQISEDAYKEHLEVSEMALDEDTLKESIDIIKTTRREESNL
ncbi:MAG: glycine/sarcosine/betaine reductase complex selenoprotein A [Candidatus Korarchaeota archaeon]|nr:glycine/sarcosine/betaine reductase complex selenoprotein A [Candidatus Korarchaeota archaeon]NIU82856.1 glycine/sarcosine/betaine reductase complex selenoprotein A [Candidatus Thorarchaeota archaeon]NIW12550.1 glycine/sarcosine/betaine reductase complex selenoprotein A [Candidatus Thorarchaeota archaeon]NIW50770.1 glycine/sarcosine/betaine reductase complex selenoprotein A [Candidatus Korarchaeota archaeon]